MYTKHFDSVHFVSNNHKLHLTWFTNTGVSIPFIGALAVGGTRGGVTRVANITASFHLDGSGRAWQCRGIRTHPKTHPLRNIEDIDISMHTSKKK